MTGRKDDDLTDTLGLIPEALRRVRQAAGRRQIDIARTSGLSKAMVSAYEGGKGLPSLPSLSAYLGAIGRDLGDLQDAMDELSGFSKRRTADVEARERAVGRAVLKALRGLDTRETARVVMFDFSGALRFTSEDSGRALIAQLPPDEELDPDDDRPVVFIRLHGWDETGEHPALRPIAGLQAFVTIEVLKPDADPPSPPGRRPEQRGS
jgi:transcriptional regulator with XRE-family HTH domain